MEYQDVRQIVRETLHQALEDFRAQKACPKCGTDTTMLKVYVEPPKDASEFAVEIAKWRCLNCLGLFTEVMSPVNE